MKFDTEKLNKELAKQSSIFRLIWEEKTAGSEDIDNRAWCACNGIMLILGHRFTIWISNKLTRYLRADNGQMWLCTDRDLKGMSKFERRQFKFDLTGIVE